MRSKRMLSLVLFAFLVCSSLSPAQDSPDQRPAQVMLDGEVLFALRGGIKAWPPPFRAESASVRILDFARDHAYRPEDVTISDLDTASIISVRDKFIITVLDLDAELENTDRQALAEDWANRIRQGIMKYRKERSLQFIVTGILYTLLATMILAGLVFTLGRFFKKAEQSVNESNRIGSVRVVGFEFFTAARIKGLMISALKFLRLAAILVLLYIYLSLGLSFFPWTRNISERLLVYVLDALLKIGNGILNQLPGLVFIAVLVIITRSVLKTLRLFFDQVRHGRISLWDIDADLADPTYKLVRLLIIAFAVVVAYPYIPGSESPAFKGISIFVGVIFSLGSTSAIGNIAAGVSILYMRAFREGDVVKVGEDSGIVLQRRLLVTRLKTFKNEEVTVPNSSILADRVINYSQQARGEGLVLHTSITIGYDAPWPKVHELLMEAALATGHVLKSPPPFVLQTALNDFYVTYELNAFTDMPQFMPRIYSELHRNIQDKFNEAGMEIMSPHYTQVRDGSHTTIPEQYLPPDYVPSSIRIVETNAAEKKSEDEEGELKALSTR